MNSVLEVPGRSDALSLIQSHASSLARLAGFDDARCLAIELACEEAFGRIMERASGSPGIEPVRMVSELNVLALTITFHDQAPPAKRLDDLASEQAAAELDEVDLGAVSRRLIRAAADSVTWMPMGRQGHRTQMVFNRPQRAIASMEPQAALQAFDEQAPLAPVQDYTVRLASEEADWHQIAVAVYRTYGYTYPLDDFYLPDRIRELNQTGLVLSAVAVTAAGEVVGHYALDVQGFGQFGVKPPFTGELGKAVVDPAHRSRGLMERMRRFVEGEARSRGLVSVFSEPTMAHPFSQKANESLGSRPSAVLLGLGGQPISGSESDRIGRSRSAHQRDVLSPAAGSAERATGACAADSSTDAVAHLCRLRHRGGGCRALGAAGATHRACGAIRAAHRDRPGHGAGCGSGYGSCAAPVHAAAGAGLRRAGHLPGAAPGRPGLPGGLRGGRRFWFSLFRPVPAV